MHVCTYTQFLSHSEGENNSPSLLKRRPVTKATARGGGEERGDTRRWSGGTRPLPAALPPPPTEPCDPRGLVRHRALRRPRSTPAPAHRQDAFHGDGETSHPTRGLASGPFRDFFHLTGGGATASRPGWKVGPAMSSSRAGAAPPGLPTTRRRAQTPSGSPRHTQWPRRPGH